MADLDFLARTALAAFRGAFASQLAAQAPFPKPLEPHVVGYKRGRNGAFGSRLLRGDYVTGKFTTADFVWGSRARFWVTVGDSSSGGVALGASLTGFGISEGQWVDQQVGGGDVAGAAGELGQAVALYVIAERYDPRFGWG